MNLLTRPVSTIQRKLLFRLYCLVFSVAFFTLIGGAKAQAAAFTSNATGNWNVGTTWGGACASSCVAGTDFPGASDTATVTSTHTVTVPTAFTANFTSVTVRGTATFKLTGQISGGDLTVKTGATVQQDTTSVQTLTGTLSIESGGTLTHTANTTAASYAVYFTVPTVSVAGTINVSSKGLQGGRSGAVNGSGTGGGVMGTVGGTGGAAYGGNGGNGNNSNGSVTTYGSHSAPDDLGSGGSYGGSTGANGGNGGGLVKIVATTVTVTGSVVANGQDGALAATYYAGGGGSGGGVYFSVTGAFNGSGGTVTANGGAGVVANVNASAGGGGGRISINGYSSYTAPTTISAYGGAAGASNAMSGGAGTIFLKSAVNLGTLTFNNNNRTNGTLSPLPSGQSLDIDEIVIQNGAVFSIPAGSTVTTTQSTFNTPSGVAGGLYITGTFNPQNSSFTFPASTAVWFLGAGTMKTATNVTLNSASSTLIRGFTASWTDFTIGSGATMTMDSYTTSTSALSLTNFTVNGTLTHTANSTALLHAVRVAASTVTVGSGGSINVDSRGYRGGLLGSSNGAGPGGAVLGTVGGVGGGAFGGNGGNGTNSAGAAAVGSISVVSDLGSGGAFGGSTGANGGAGGGFVDIVATTMTVNGTISANGQAGTLAATYYGGGGGSGGGISLVVAGTFTGTSGVVRANGGAGIAANVNGGGGGSGGRVLISGYTSYSAPTTLTANGGAGGVASAQAGGAGSVFVKSSSNLGTVTYSNNAATNSAHSPLSSVTIDEVIVRSGAILSIPAGVSVTSTQSTFSNPTAASIGFHFAGTFNPQSTSFTIPSSTATLIASTANLRETTSLTLNSVSSTIVPGLTHALTSLTIGTGATLTMVSYTTGTTPLTVATMTIDGTVTHPVNVTAQSHIVSLSATTFTLSSGASINVDNKGYRGGLLASTSGLGPGRSAVTVAGGVGGAAHGGSGGNGNASVGSTSTYGILVAPDTIGSGGAHGGVGAADGGYGGGHVWIAASTMTIAGTISANGQVGTSASLYYAGGGGSGGSVYLDAGSSFNGTGGTIRANGGAGIAATANASGGGGGGRIAIGSFEGSIASVGTITVTGGTKGSGLAQDGYVGTKASRPDSVFFLEDNYTNTTLPANVSGTSSYQFNAVSSMHVSIQRVSDSLYWNGSAWDAAVSWLVASGTSTWEYALSGVSLTDLQSYTVKSRATDSLSVQEASYTSKTFAYSADAAPAAPTGLAESSVSTSTLSLAWTDNSSGASQETSFIVYRSTDNSVYESVATLAADTVTTNLSGLTPNTLYYFKITALNTDNGASTSTEVSTTTRVMAPSALSAGTATVSSIPLTWSASGNAAGTVYEVLNQTTSTWLVATTTGVTYTVTGLAGNTAYTFAVRAIQANQSPTAYSGAATVSVSTLPDAPTAPTGLVFSSIANTTGVLTWTDNASGENQESSIIVYRSTDAATYSVFSSYPADTVLANLTSLTPNTTYYFKVTATNVSGSSTSTAVATTTLVNAPTAFTSGTITTSTIPLTWSANGNANTTVYELYNETTSTWMVTSTTATSYLVTGLDSNTAYTYTLRAIQADSSPTTYSSEVSFSGTTVTNIPEAPTSLLFTDVATSTLTLSWTDNASGGTQETSVVVSRSTDGVSYSTVATLSADAVTRNFTGLTPNTTYYYKVTATNVSGSGVSSAVSTSTVVMAPTSFSSGLTTTSTVPLTWSANGNAAGTVYEILNNTTSTWSVATTTASSYTVRNLISDTDYVFGLRAIQQGVAPTVYSAELTYATTTYVDAPSAPTGLAFSSVASSTLTLSWSDTANVGDSNQETSVLVLRSTDDVTYSTVATLSADAVTTGLTGLTPNKTYYFKISATNRSGSGTTSAVSTSTIVMAPTSLTSATVTTSTVPLTWSANGNAAGTVYEVLNQTTSTWTVATTTATSYTVRGLSVFTSYSFALRATQSGSSPVSYSAEATVATTTLTNTPGAPTDLIFANVATSTLTLSWTDNASGDVQESSVVVSRSTDNVSYSTVATLSADSVTTNVTGLTPNQTYYFKVTAANLSGSGVSSAASTSTSVVAPVSFMSSAVTVSVIPLTWSANGNAAATIYEVLNQTTSTWTMATTTATSYTVTGLDSNTAYTFGLRAKQAGVEGTAYSSTVTYTTTTALDAPLAPAALLISNVATSTLTLAWTDNASGGMQETSMIVSRSTDDVSYSTVATLAADSVTTDLTGLTPNRLYYFKVAAVNASGSSVSTSVSTSTIVMAPTSLTSATVTPSTVPLTWSANGNGPETVYEILNQTTSTWSIATTTATTYIVTGLVYDTEYTFAVRATQLGSDPATYSSTVSYTDTTYIEAPTAPTGLVLSGLTSSTVSLSWTDTASGDHQESDMVVSRSEDGVTYSPVMTLGADATSYAFVGLTPNSEVFFKVTASNRSGSGASTAVSTSTFVMPPTLLAVTAGTTSTIALSWGANGNPLSTVYELRNITTSTWVIATTTARSFTVTSLTSLTTYSFELRAIQAGSDPTTYSEAQSVSSTTLIDTPSAPSDLLLTEVTSSTARLTWTDNSHPGNQEVNFLVVRSTDGVSYSTVLTLDRDVTSALVSGLSPNQEYYFKVSSVNETASVLSEAIATTTRVVAPTSFIAGAPTAFSAPLSWNANGNVGGTVYVITNHTTSSWMVATTTATTFTVSGLEPNESYTFGLRAVQAGSDPLEYSETLFASSTTSYDVPTAPTGLVLTDVGAATAILEWTDTSSGGTQELNMIVSRSTDDISYSTIATLDADTVRREITGLVPNTTYYFKVTAENAAGSAGSGSLATTTRVVAPSAFATSSAPTITSVALSWSSTGNSAGTVYELLNNTTSSWTIATTTGVSYVVNGLDPLTTYDFELRAVQRTSDPVVYSTSILLSETTLPLAPSAPVALSLSSVGTSTVALTWTDTATGPNQESSIQLLRSINDIAYSTYTTYPADTTSVVITGLAEGTRYFFKLRVLNASGSDTSITVSTTTIDRTPTAAPSAFTAVGSGADVALSWVNPVDSDFASVILRRGTVSYPLATTDGTSVFSGTATETTDEDVDDATYYYSLFAVDSSGNISAAATSSALVDTVAPDLTAITATPGTVDALVSWTSDSLASSKVIYSVNETFASSTLESDLGADRTTSHEVEVSNLLPCVTYAYKVVSVDASSNSSTSTSRTFTTNGCVGGAGILESTSEAIPIATGGSVLLGLADERAALTIPVGYAEEDSLFQVKRLERAPALVALGLPDEYQNLLGQHIFDFRAFNESQTPLRSFEEPIQVVMHYATEDLSSLEEETVRIFRNDGGEWILLDACAVDALARTVTCTTTHFSIFGLFGRSVSVAESPVASAPRGSGALVSYGVTAKALNGAELSFSANEGATSTDTSSVRLSLNADPATVRGYAVSLDPTFAQASILPYSQVVAYQLPSRLGKYTLYLVYFSKTGDRSNVISRTIDLVASRAVSGPVTPQKSVLTTKKLFTKNRSLGAVGEDVKRLQQFLNTHGYVIAKKGPGSPKNETTRYGSATKAAVMRYQKANKLTPANGDLHEKTRALINTRLP